MLASEVIREVMKIKGVTTSVLSKRLGVAQNTLSERYKQKNISVGKLNETIRAMDYKIIVVPGNTRLPEGGFEVE